ncbi:ribosomal protein L22 [Borrelia yangtzensis]|uniref:Ribosomal protein L22 n=1 Tax=Borreliella yangtzensis TaxID=683292 RepID=A0ABR6PF47_9SPIR|nr:ribosomal protein L22 [Borreliella yangtzensis]MBB6043371.1 ribosomal protein L22 [Borreliella yangtzensis]
MEKNYFVIITYFLSFLSCNLANSSSKNKGFEFNQSEKIIEKNLKLKEDHLKSEAIQNDLIVKIMEIVKLIEAKTILDRAKIEPLDQFGMKDFVFNNLIVDSNHERYSHNENKDVRRKFYSSLNYNEPLIRVFGKILNKISSNVNNQNLDLLIVKAGQYYSQYELEHSAKKINEQMDKLTNLNTEELNLILSKLKELKTFKTRWIDIVNQIVGYCTNNINLNGDIKDDFGKMIRCIEHINLKYEYFLKHEILKTEILSYEITKILDK